MDTDNLMEYLRAVVSPLLGNSDDLQIEKKTDEMGVLYTLKVNSEDAGKVLGVGGGTAKAIRKLLLAVGMKYQIRASLKIDVPRKEAVA